MTSTRPLPGQRSAVAPLITTPYLELDVPAAVNRYVELTAALPGTAVHYARAITRQTAYRRFTRARCPHAESWAAECVSLPCFPEMTDDEVERVREALR